MGPNKAMVAMAVALGALVLVSGWQTWTLIGLQARVAALEVPAGPTATGGVAQADPTDEGAPAVPEGPARDGVARAMQGWREARKGEGAVDEEVAATRVEEAVEEALSEALDRHAEAREDEQRRQQREIVTQSVEMIVEDLRDTHGFSAEAQDELIEMFVGGIELGERLRKELEDGALTVREAKEQSREARRGYHERSLALIGEEATAALGDKIWPGFGWRLDE